MKKRFVLLLYCVIFAGILAGCGDTAPESQEDEKPTVTVEPDRDEKDNSELIDEIGEKLGFSGLLGKDEEDIEKEDTEKEDFWGGIKYSGT